MSDNVIQPSFSAGELAPSMFARTDIAKYHTGAALMRNFFVDYRSGASTRPGTEFITPVRYGTGKARLIPFQYSTITSFVLEFGNGYIRFINNGGLILENTQFGISAATNTSVCQITVPGNNYVFGDIIFLSGIKGMTQLNGRYVEVLGGGNTFPIGTPGVGAIDSTNFGVFAGAGQADRVYIIGSPYADTELPLLKFTQSPTVMTLTHPNHPPYDLTIISPNQWTIALSPLAPLLPTPTGLTTAAIDTGNNHYIYAVTGVDANGRESLPSTETPAGPVGTTVQLTWTSTGAISYNVYKSNAMVGAITPVAGVGLGFIGSTTANSFIDSNISPQFTAGPPTASILPTGFQPEVATYFQQRKIYAATTAQPQDLWASKTGDYGNFYVSQPLQADDAIHASLVSNQVNAIKSMLPMPGGLIIFTSSGAWQLSGGGGFGAAQAVTALNATAIPQAYNGANDMPPIVLNYDVLFVQARGSIIRDLSYNLYAQIYTGTDISVIANHLFFDHSMVEWGFAEEPFKMVWVVRDDGVLLSLTFVKEQQIEGWGHHDTQGRFESVCTVGEGLVNATYVVVRRFVQGIFLRYIERFAERTDFTYGSEDAWSVDAGVQSALYFPIANMTVEMGASGTLPHAAVVTMDVPGFSPSHVGWVVRAGGGIATVISFLNPSQ